MRLLKRLFSLLGFFKKRQYKKPTTKILSKEAERKTNRLIHLVAKEKQLKRKSYGVRKRYQKAPSIR